MLGRKILTRITRFGLAFYATVWCMSFTVCAYDNPLADMAVSNRMTAFTEDVSGFASSQQEDAEPASEDKIEGTETELTTPEGQVQPEDPAPGDEENNDNPAPGNETEPAQPAPEGGQNEEGQPADGEAVQPADGENPEEPADPEASEEGDEGTLPEDTENPEETEEIEDVEGLENETEDLIDAVEEIDDNQLVKAEEEAGFHLSVMTAARDYSTEYYNLTRDYDYGFTCSGSIEDSFVEQNATTKTEFRAVKLNYSDPDQLWSEDNIYSGIVPRYGEHKAEDYYGKIRHYQYVIFNFNENWKQSNGNELYIVGRYNYTDSDGVIQHYYSRPLHVDVYIPVNETVMCYGTGEEAQIAQSVQLPKKTIDTEKDPQAIEKFSEELYLNTSQDTSLELQADRISWSVMEEREDGNYTVTESRGVVVTPVDDTNQNVTIKLNKNFDESGHFVVVANYNNNFILSNRSSRSFSSAYAYAEMDIEYKLPPREAHLSEPAIKMQVFNSENIVPVTLRIEEENKSQSFRYNINSVEFADSPAKADLDKYIELIAFEDKSVNLRAKSELVNMDSKLLAKFIKNKYSTPLVVNAKVNGISETYTTKENLTITFGNTLPTVKDLKFNNTLTFNSFFAGQEMGSSQLYFKSPSIGSVVAEDPAKLETMGFKVYSDGVVATLNDTLPAAKKGSFNINVTISDSRYNLPDGFMLKTKVNYVVKNNPPVIKNLSKSSIVLNSLLKDNCTLEFDVDDGYYNGAGLSYKILDKNNKDITSEKPLNVTFDYRYYWEWGEINISCLNETAPGQTYKVSIYPINTKNNRTGTAKVITVKTVAEKDQGNPSITVKGKGTIDACKPYSVLNMTLTAKNFNLYGKDQQPIINVALKNGTDITNCFDYHFNSYSNILYVGQNTSDTHFPLLEKGYAGQQITITAGFNITGGTDLCNVTYNTKIAKSKVTPKLKTTSTTINPSYYSAQSIYVDLINDYANYYDYDLVFDFGKDKSGNNITSPFTASMYYSDCIVIDSPSTDLSAFVGKTGTLKITPKIPGGNAGTATFKIQILNPAKSKASITVKAKGSIDAIKNPYYSYVNITTTFKNYGFTESSYVDVNCVNITTTINKKEVSCKDLFEFYTYSGNIIRIRRKSDQNLTVGTYKAYVRATYRSAPLYTGSGNSSEPIYATLEKTVTFKVTRGKAGATFNPSTVKLVNRDFTRYTNVNISSKTKYVTGITNVEIADAKYKDNLRITSQSGNTYRLEFSNGFYETSKVGKLILAIKKSVTKTIKVNVYYQGSSVPEKVNMKVKIVP